MLDGLAKRAIEPTLDRIGRFAATRGVSANAVTVAGFALGVAAALAIVTGYFGTALLLGIASRALDGLDGAVARATQPTDFGGYLDIVLDFAFYGLIPFAFVLYAPQANGVGGALLILSFYVNGASFLAYAAIAEKRALTSSARGVKSLYFTTGLAEASETVIVFALFCLFPAWFAPIAYVFAAICFYTALSRIVLAASLFG
jgi:phosphatidylglycerophosphate synthase